MLKGSQFLQQLGFAREDIPEVVKAALKYPIPSLREVNEIALSQLFEKGSERKLIEDQVNA
ncbi:MAG: hypothetical protein AAF600_15915 [Bacteroidota bacterium]